MRISLQCPLSGERVLARTEFGRQRALILVDDLQRHKALAGVRQRDRHRSRVQIEHSGGIEGIAVHPNDRLSIDRRQLLMVFEFAEPVLLDRFLGACSFISARSVASAASGHARGEGRVQPGRLLVKTTLLWKARAFNGRRDRTSPCQP